MCSVNVQSEGVILCNLWKHFLPKCTMSEIMNVEHSSVH